MQKLLTFFSKNISIYTYTIFNDQSFKNMLTDDIVKFWTTGPMMHKLSIYKFYKSGVFLTTKIKFQKIISARILSAITGLP